MHIRGDSGKKQSGPTRVSTSKERENLESGLDHKGRAEVTLLHVECETARTYRWALRRVTRSSPVAVEVEREVESTRSNQKNS